MEQHLLAGTLLGRLGWLSEVAQAVLFLCSEDASYPTGTTLTVDGGLPSQKLHLNDSEVSAV